MIYLRSSIITVQVSYVLRTNSVNLPILRNLKPSTCKPPLLTHNANSKVDSPRILQVVLLNLLLFRNDVPKHILRPILKEDEFDQARESIVCSCQALLQDVCLSQYLFEPHAMGHKMSWGAICFNITLINGNSNDGPGRYTISKHWSL